MANTKVKAEQLEAAQTNITSLGTLTALQVDNLNLNGNTISSTDTNGNITIAPNGTGDIYANTDKMIVLAAEGESATLMIVSDESDDNGDDWSFVANQSNNTLTIENDISGSSVAHLTLTPHATVASSTATFAGILSVGNINVNGNTISSTNTNGNIIITPNGTGNVNVNTDVLAIQGTEGETASLALQVDESDDAGDEWRFTANTNQTLSIKNNISGSEVDHITLTPHATVASSTVSIPGVLSSGEHIVAGASYATLRLEENDATDLNTSMFNSGGDFVITTSSDNRSTTTDRLRLDHATGNIGVGIGTTVDELLHLEKSSGSTIVKTEVAANSTVGFEIAKTGSTTQRWRIVDGQTVNGKLEFYDVTDSRSVMTFDGAGNVGIGTSTPDHKLHVVDGNNYALLGDTQSNSTMSLRMADSSTYPVEIQAYSSELRFNTASSSGATPTVKMTVKPDGNVGIGTTAPATLLDLRKTTAGNITGGTANQGAELTLHHEAQWENGYTGGDFLGSILFSSGDGSTGEGTRAAIKTSVDTYYNTNKLRFYVAASNSTTLTERMQINHSGKVGIGTQDPQGDLHLSHGSTNNFTPGNDSWHTMVIHNTSADDSNSTGIALEVSGEDYHGNAGTGIAAVKNGTDADYGADLVFITRPQSAQSEERMRISDSGLVGIGINAPTANLHVKAHGTANNSSDAKFYIDKNSSNDWTAKFEGTGGVNYGLNIQGNGGHAIVIYNNSNNSDRGRWNFNGELYTSDGNVHDIDSDISLKEDISDAPSQWQMFKDLKLQRFKWKDRRLGDIYSYGWIAQVVENDYPEFVRLQPASLEQERAGETPTLKTVQSGTIQKRAIAALQEAMERIEALEAKVVALESK